MMCAALPAELTHPDCRRGTGGTKSLPLRCPAQPQGSQRDGRCLHRARRSFSRPPRSACCREWTAMLCRDGAPSSTLCECPLPLPTVYGPCQHGRVRGHRIVVAGKRRCNAQSVVSRARFVGMCRAASACRTKDKVIARTLKGRMD